MPAPATGVLRHILYAVGTVVRAKTTVTLIADAEVSDKLLED